MLEQFLANPNLRPATKKHYRAVISRFHQFVEEKSWEEVTAADLGQWLDQYEQRTLDRRTGIRLQMGPGSHHRHYLTAARHQ